MARRESIAAGSPSVGVRKEHQWVGGIWARSGLSLLEAWLAAPLGSTFLCPHHPKCS